MCLDREKIDPGRALHPIGHGLRIAVRARDQRVKAANALRPGKRVEVILHAQHGRRVDGRALEDLPVELAAFGQPEDLWHRPFGRVALQALDGTRRQDEHPVSRLAAENFLPGIGDHIELRPIEALRENARSRVADGEALPVRRDPICVRYPHAGRGSVPGKDDIAREIDLAKIWQVSVGGLHDAHVAELQLLDDIDHPILAEGLPGQHVDTARAEQRPQRHLHRAGIGARDDGDEIIVRQLEQSAGSVEGKLQPRLAGSRAVRTAEDRVLEVVERPAGAFGARAGGEERILRPRRGPIGSGHLRLPFQIDAPRWGGVSRLSGYEDFAAKSS